MKSSPLAIRDRGFEGGIAGSWRPLNLDDPFPGLYLAAVRLTWNLGATLIASAILSFFFSYAYFLLNNFSRAKLLQITNGNGRLEQIKRYLDRLPRTTNTVVSIEIAAKVVFALGTLVFFSRLQGEEASVDFWTLLWTFVTVSLWFVLFCRVLPSELGTHKEEEILVKILPLLNGLGVCLYPLHLAVEPFRRGVERIFLSNDPEAEAEQITEEIIDAVEEGEREGVIHEDAADMIEAIVELRDSEVFEIMTPRTDMKAIEASTSLGEAVRFAMDVGYSRMPVYEEDPDHIVGVLYLKDVINLWSEDRNIDPPLKTVVRKPYFIPETKKVSNLLEEFRRNKIHIAIVLDEYGGTAGLVTNEDILEEIVGDITDEYDPVEAAEIRRIDEKTLDVAAKVHVDDLIKEYGITIPESDDFETIGGFIFSSLGKVPELDETVEVKNARLVVTDVTDRRIKRVKIHIVSEKD